ncbi:MAG: hypothetical protein AAGD38_08280 [Acidobacteriota bacterium]
MDHVFTHHLRALAASDPIDHEQIDEVRQALEHALDRELRRRGLRQLSPTLLGVHGSTSWSDRDARDELVAECYVFIFVHRLRGLRAQLTVKPHIEGLIALNVRHFVFERQKAYDPLGYRTYEVMHRAVQLALDAHILHAEDETLDNRTMLATSADVATTEPAGETELSPHVMAWSDDLVPAVAVAHGRAELVAISQRLYPRFDDLGHAGIARFRFKNLVDAVKRLVRGGWAAILDTELGDSGFDVDMHGTLTRVRSTPPDTGVDDHQALGHLTRRVEERIAAREDERSRQELRDLWHLIRAHVAADTSTGRGRASDQPHAGLPSQRQLSDRLGVHRRRIGPLLATLQGIVREATGASR